MKINYDVAILGGGPGGYVSAIRAGQLGFKTILIDKSNLGGICLNWGCIPTKSLLKNAEFYDTIKNHSEEFGISVKNLSFDFKKIIKRSRDISEKISKNVELLVKKNKVERIRGFGKLKSKNQIDIFDEKENIANSIYANNIIIATGASPREIPNIKIDREFIITSSEAMTLTELPKELTIIGAGAIGVEFAYFYSILGTKVTLIEMLDSVLPLEDREVSQLLEKNFRKRGIEIFTSTIVDKAEVKNRKVLLTIKNNSEQKVIKSEKVLVAVGVSGNIHGFGLEELGIEIFKNHIKVDKKNYQTNISNIFAIGDVIGPPWLAHVASAEGIHCIETIKGMNNLPLDYSSVPSCVYCNPQIASIGITDKIAREKNIKIKVGKFPFIASGKAFATGDREGFVKLIFDEKYGELIGASIIGAEATELIAELGIAKSHGATYESIMKTIHAHPTLSESIMEASAQSNAEAIHI